VAVLGDSVVEGLGVSDAQTFTRLLEEKFSQKIEFMNFGTSGNFGTTQELLLYQHLVRQFEPDLVILAFTNWNDLADNSWWYWKSFDPGRRRPYFVKVGSDRYDLFYPNDEGVAGLIMQSHIDEHVQNTLSTNSYLFRLAYAAYHHIMFKLKYAASLAVENAYNAHPDEKWTVSWDVTEHALRLLKEEVDHDHAKLIILQIADHLQIDPAQATAINSREGYSTLYPNQRIERLATQLGVAYFSLYDPFVAVRDSRGMKPPYFGNTCDPHWNPLGHEVAAEAIYRYLQRSRLFLEMAQ
jgi:lysophospholipase L1-like esterase